MIHFFAIGLFALSSIGAFAVPDLGKVTTFNDLSSYLRTYTNGAVKPVQQSYLSFKVDQKNNIASPVLPAANPNLIHSLFETDVQKIIKNQGASDFVTAKRKFYQAQSFNTKTQQFSRPYVYPSDWHSLFHNPVKSINLPLEVYGEQFRPLDSKSIEQSPLLEVGFQNNLDDITNSELTSGNKLKLLLNGDTSFREKLRMVRESKYFFHAIVMVQYCDETGSEMVDALIERAKAGVDVRLVTEKVWTELILKKCLAKLRNGGVKVILGGGFFNPKTMFTVHHTKFWIRDGEEAIMGGQNMHDFENSSNGFNNHTRDKDVHVVGPAVTDMMREYVRIWNHENGKYDSTMTPYLQLVAKKQAQEKEKGQRGKDHYSEWLKKEDVRDIPGVCRVLVQGSKTSANTSSISKAYIEIMKHVKYNMVINTLSFRYNEEGMDAYTNTQIIRNMVDASKRGVKVDLVTNGVDAGFGEAGFQLRTLADKLRSKGHPILANALGLIEKVFGANSAKTQRKNLLKGLAGTDVNAWYYFNHIHSKQMNFDQIMTSTGSFNLDSYSYKNHESTMICLDKKLSDDSMVGFVSDIVNSSPVFQ